jgi:hypothetical protein
MPILLKARREYRLKNRSRINQKSREWRANNRSAVRGYRQNYKKSKNYMPLSRASKIRFRKAHHGYDRAYSRRVREEVIRRYGGKCKCCGIDNYEFLSIDHIKGNGLKHRRKLNIEGQKFIFWLRRKSYPKGFQILCHNCNQALGHYGFCPHRPRIRRKVLHARNATRSRSSR